MKKRTHSTRAPGAATPGAPVDAATDLAPKYAALCAKYRRLVEKFEAVSVEHSSATALALAAMRAGVTALAAIRTGRCVVRNDRWLGLACERGRAWRPLGTASPAVLPRDPETLEALAAEGAVRLLASGDALRLGRWETGDAEQVVEMRLERVAGASPPIVLAMITDVTEPVRGERELARLRDTMEAQERLRAIGELASGIAHDLNNTLHAMRLRLSRLATCVSGDPEHAENLRVVERITADAASRVRKLQDLARRREDVPDERVELPAAIANAIEVMRSSLADPPRSHAVDVSLPPLPVVMGSEAEIAHVFVNLLSNARDAMPAGGRVAIEGSVTPAGWAEVTVSDEGSGIPPDLLHHIFDPFVTTKGRRGTGLGLSMAMSVVRRIGGTIAAENRPAGGARFTLRFPPASARDVRAPAAPVATAAPVPVRRVLVVDDDPDNLDAMRLVLEDCGQSVDVTPSGREATARVESGERYDVILCDLGLGDTTGWEVAERIAAAAPSTRFLLVTGWAEEIPLDDPRRRHVAAVLPKPLGAAELREILREAPALGAPGARPVASPSPNGAPPAP